MIKKRYLLTAAITLLTGCNFNDSENKDSALHNEVLSWQPNAGNATAEFDPDFPFLQFIPGLDLAELANASKGRELFTAEWTAAPGSRPLLDGLGPLTITSACSNCHFVSSRTPSLKANGEVGLGLLFRLGDELGNHDPYYGGQLQTAATTGSSEGHVSWQKALTLAHVYHHS
jgi:CxxC motif-containing protein (DUF1111 family)